MTDLTKLTAEELSGSVTVAAADVLQEAAEWAEILRRLERLESAEKQRDEWKVAADILGERLIATEKRLEKSEAEIAEAIAYLQRGAPSLALKCLRDLQRNDPQ